jgi:hypothetical protein
MSRPEIIVDASHQLLVKAVEFQVAQQALPRVTSMKQ